MTTKSDWDAAADEFTSAERERLGGPPSPDEVIAFQRGELPPDEAARVRALLVYYPGLTSLLAEEEPPAAGRTLRFANPGRSVALWRAAAAVFLLVAIGASVQWMRVQRELREPYVLAERHVLSPAEETRGAPAPANRLPSREDRYYLVLPSKKRDFPAYRVDVVSGGRTLWSRPIERQPNQTFELTAGRGFFDDGTSRIDLYGVDGTRTELLEHYLVRVAGD